MNNETMLRQVRKCIRTMRNIETALAGEEVTFLDPPPTSPPSKIVRDVRYFIDNKLGRFEAAIISATDMMLTLKDPAYAEYIFSDTGLFTPVRIGRVMRHMGMCFNVTMNGEGKGARAWVIRDHNTYKMMNSAELYFEYQAQHSQFDAVGEE